tara:strand:+ start:345 stop:593 length:249 start_codon:yes stop_codon:yes gene_type:complete
MGYLTTLRKMGCAATDKPVEANRGQARVELAQVGHISGLSECLRGVLCQHLQSKGVTLVLLQKFRPLCLGATGDGIIGAVLA